MSKIHVSCIDQVLKVVKSPVVASGGLNEVTVVFAFCELWEGFEKTAYFYREGEDKIPVILDENDACILPSEVTAENGTFHFFVAGVNGATRRTTTNVKYKVVKGAVISEDYPEAPTKDIYDQIMVLFNETNENKEIIESFVQTIVNEYPDILTKFQELETRLAAVEKTVNTTYFTIDGVAYEVDKGTTWESAIDSGVFGVHECPICQATVTELYINDGIVYQAENDESCGDCGGTGKDLGGYCVDCGSNNWIKYWFDGEGIGTTQPLFDSNGEYVNGSDVIGNAAYYINDVSKLPKITFTLDGREYETVKGNTWKEAIGSGIFDTIDTVCCGQVSRITYAHEVEGYEVGELSDKEGFVCGACGTEYEEIPSDGFCKECGNQSIEPFQTLCMACGGRFSRLVYNGDNQVYGYDTIEAKEYVLS